jgi:hypothetical protein
MVSAFGNYSRGFADVFFLGFIVKFGLQYVNLTTQERSYKASFFEYVNAFKLYAEDPVVPVFVST